jgi:hypothetical protein
MQNQQPQIAMFEEACEASTGEPAAAHAVVQAWAVLMSMPGEAPLGVVV